MGQKEEEKKKEEERKALKKQREKERLAKLKAEGKLLTAKQRQANARAEAMLEARRAQGADVPLLGEKRGPRPGTRIRQNKKKHQEVLPETHQEAQEKEDVKAPQEEVKDEPIVK